MGDNGANAVEIPSENDLVFISRAGQSALLWIEVAAASAFVGFRTWIQFRHNKRLFSNDILILIALTLHFASALISQLMIPPMYELERLKVILQYGQVPPANTEERTKLYLKYQFAVCITFWCCLWAVKFSLLLFFWRMFDSLHTRVRIFWWVMCFITASTLAITIILQLVACGEPGAFFRLGPEGCFTERDIYMSNLVFLFSCGTDIACDVFLILIPFPLLWKLQVSPRQKITLVLIFLLPLIPICFGILRLVFCNPVVGTVDVIKFTFYFSMENTAAIITACLPSMRLFFLKKSGNTTAASHPYSGNKQSQAYAVGGGTSNSTRGGLFSNTKKSLFGTTSVTSTHLRSSQRNEYTKGGIMLTDIPPSERELAHDEGGSMGTSDRRESAESRKRILDRHSQPPIGRGDNSKMQVIVTREYSVGTAVSTDGDADTDNPSHRTRMHTEDVERGKPW